MVEQETQNARIEAPQCPGRIVRTTSQHVVNKCIDCKLCTNHCDEMPILYLGLWSL